MAALALMLGHALPGHARPQTPFQQHYEHAISLYQAGHLEAALEEFRQAYALRQLPRLLVNIGKLYRKLGHPQEAKGFYELYLKMEPSPPREIKGEVDRDLAELMAQLRSAEQAAEPRPAPAALPSRAPATAAVVPAAARPLDLAAPAPAGALAGIPLVPTPPLPAHQPLYKKWWLWTAVGAVAAGAVAGAVAGTHGRAPMTMPSASMPPCPMMAPTCVSAAAEQR